jgi:hypothetical protein
MRIGLSPGTLLEAAVSIAVAILMAVAGYEMLYGNAPSMHDIAMPASTPGVAVPAPTRGIAAPPQPAPSFGAKVAMPHVDELSA